MKQDEIIKMARQAGFVWLGEYHSNLEDFAKLVAQHEREACAGLRKGVELKGKCSTEYEEGFWEGLSKYEDLIRARGKAK